MGLRRTKMNENNATIFILIRVLSYPCFHYPWLFSQECFMLKGERVLLRAMERGDLERLWQFNNDLAVELAGVATRPCRSRWRG
ncbi:MAG: hypothetical protein IPL78_08830 [Chloroflexi bacterium]|nr:hypothetical protein [Chloroflexota bacterium]